MTVTWDGDRWDAAGEWYRLHGTRDGLVSWLDDRTGRRWSELRLLASVDPVGGRDETLAVEGPHVDGDRLTWQLRSSRWTAKRLVIDALPGGLDVHAEVEGDGEIGELSLLAGRAILARTNGRLMSGAWFESVVSGGPNDPGRIVRPATESQDIGVVSGSEPGRGAWFFTPGPFVFAANRTSVSDPVSIPDGPWLAFGLAAGAGESSFTTFSYAAVDRGFGFTLDYEGKTRVARRWRSPVLRIRTADDPYDAIAGWRDELARDRGTAPERRAVPDWWLQPIFCGWGAQAALARAAGLGLGAAARHSTQSSYDAFLRELDAHGIRPGTVVIDDKWQAAYGTCVADTGRWPDLRGWIAARRAAGQRVLLWYKAWDPEGVSADACIRSASGVPLGIDPTSPAGEAAIRRGVRRMLGRGAGELDADGLKIDFTGRTPSGVATVRHGDAWGVDLLRLLLEVVADEARSVRPDALLIGHSPHPHVAPALGMLRLNDALRLDDPTIAPDIVPQMRHRAAIIRAACPDVPIDTDDWCAPSLAGWRAYAAMKTELGVPALYVTTTIDLTGERLEERDHALIRDTWSRYRERLGLPEPSSS